MGLQTGGSGSGYVEFVVVEEQDAFGRQGELFDHVLECLTIRFEKTCLVGRVVCFDECPQSHLPRQFWPVDGVRVAHRGQPVCRPEIVQQLFDTVEEAVDPSFEGGQEDGRRDGEAEFGDCSLGESTGINLSALEGSNSVGVQPLFPKFGLGHLAGHPLQHRRNTGQSNEYAAQVEQDNVDQVADFRPALTRVPDLSTCSAK